MVENREKEHRDETTKDKVPFGYIYKVTNTKNGKIYIGQAKEGRKGKGKTAIEKRWNSQIERSYRFQRWNKNHPIERKRLRYIENAINKYGKEFFILEEIDIAFSDEELNQKERYWIRFYDTRDHSKGYNLREGGEGGRHHERTIFLISEIVQQKYQEKEYREKQIQERRERAKNPEWIEKMTWSNKEKARNPIWIERMTRINRERAKDSEYRKKNVTINQREKQKSKMDRKT